MPDLALFAPFDTAVSTVLAAAHGLLAGLLPTASPGLLWTGSIVLLVLAVRALLLPLVAHSVRAGRAAARRQRPAGRA